MLPVTLEAGSDRKEKQLLSPQRQEPPYCGKPVLGWLGLDMALWGSVPFSHRLTLD